MSKKLMKMAVGGTHAPVLTGTSAFLAIAAGVAAVVGVSTLHKRQTNGQIVTNGNKGMEIQVALLRVHVPQNFRDLVKNDVLLEKSIANVAQTLFIYVTGRDKHEILNYTSELYCLAWDAACLAKKPLLDIRIVDGFPNEQGQRWDDLMLQPNLNAVFGEDALVDVQQLNAKRFERDGLFAVTYHPLSMHIERRLSSEFHYFENEHTDLTPRDIVMLGGTFDHLHNGHKKLLSLAASICARKMVVGVTSDTMLRMKKHAELIEPIDQRKHNVEAYVRFLNPHIIIEVVTIEDPFGPATIIPGEPAMVLSTETIDGGLKVNAIRKQRGLPRAGLFVCRRTEGSTLSSSFIRDKLAAAKAS